jgi:phosphoribosyl 1,2-cyclic phosphodiesterase/CheY-like chemotaxis protein
MVCLRSGETMDKKLKFYIVDDDRIHIKLLSKFLEDRGHSVSHNTSSPKGLADIIEQVPDCIILDMMMPEMDGLELIKRLRKEPHLDKAKIIVVSGKSYEFDRKRAFAFKADGYITKPIDTTQIVTQLERIVEDRMELTFWGVHGTMPVPGKKTTRYGGNTSCVTLDFSKGNLFIFDAGTGIKALSDYLMANNRILVGTKIFISHPHWDHINALPFFVPLYNRGNEIEICGPAHGDISMKEMISGQMDGVYFPINIKEFGAMVTFRDLMEEEFEIDGIKIKTMLLNHPGHCLGYRVDYKGRSICYLTDNELYPKSNRFHNEYYLEHLVKYINQADALITDATYTDEEYEIKVGWGHSAISQVVDLAHRARVKTLYLFHHDPDQTDEDIDAKLETARTLLEQKKSKTRVEAPHEGQVVKL